MTLTSFPKIYSGLWLGTVLFFLLSRYDLIPRMAWSIEKWVLTVLALAMVVIAVPTAKYLFDKKMQLQALAVVISALPLLYWLYIFIVD